MKLWQQLVVIVVSKWHKNWLQYYIEMEGWKEVGNNECIQQNKQFYWSGVCVFHNEAFCYSHVILFLCVVCVITNSLIHLSAFDNCYMLSLKHHDFKILPIIILKFVIHSFDAKQSQLGISKSHYGMTTQKRVASYYETYCHLTLWSSEPKKDRRVRKWFSWFRIILGSIVTDQFWASLHSYQFCSV